MKRVLFYLFLTLCGLPAMQAQSETPMDTLRTDAGVIAVKNFDGFLLDMSLMQSVMPAPYLPKYSLQIPDASKDFSYLFRLNPDVTYTQGYTSLFSTFGKGSYYTASPFGLSTFGAGDNLQMGSFKLKNGMRLNTYGQYDKDGRRVFNPSALPWERNDFKGAFELKSANGNFGIRIEVEKK